MSAATDNGRPDICVPLFVLQPIRIPFRPGANVGDGMGEWKDVRQRLDSLLYVLTPDT